MLSPAPRTMCAPALSAAADTRPPTKLSVRPAAALRLAVGQVTLAVQLPGGRPGFRIVLLAGTLADVEPQAGLLVAAGVDNDVGPVAVGQHHHIGGPPRRVRRHLPQLRQRPGRDRTGPAPGSSHRASSTSPPAATTTRVPLLRPCRRRRRAASAVPASAPKLASLADSVGPGHLPGVLPFGW